MPPYALFNRRAQACSGRFFLDDELLWKEGDKDFARYTVEGSEPLSLDLFVDPGAWTPPDVQIG